MYDEIDRLLQVEAFNTLADLAKELLSQRDELMKVVRNTYSTLCQSDQIPLIVLQDVRWTLNEVNQRLNLP